MWVLVLQDYLLMFPHFVIPRSGSSLLGMRLKHGVIRKTN